MLLILEGCLSIRTYLLGADGHLSKGLKEDLQVTSILASGYSRVDSSWTQ